MQHFLEGIINNLKIVTTKFLQNRLGIDEEINEKLTSILDDPPPTCYTHHKST